MSISDLASELSPRQSLANWSCQDWITRCVTKGERVRAMHRDYFDSVAVLLQHWTPDTPEERARLRVFLQRGVLPDDAPPAMIREALTRVSLYWKETAVDVLRALFVAYQGEIVSRLNSEAAVTPPDSIYLADLRARLGGALALVETLGDYRKVLVGVLRDTTRRNDEAFELVLLPRLQSSIELAHNHRLLSESVVDPYCWWGRLAINAGEVVTHDAPPDPPELSPGHTDAQAAKLRTLARSGEAYVKRRGRSVR